MLYCILLYELIFKCIRFGSIPLYYIVPYIYIYICIYVHFFCKPKLLPKLLFLPECTLVLYCTPSLPGRFQNTEVVYTSAQKVVIKGLLNFGPKFFSHMELGTLWGPLNAKRRQEIILKLMAFGCQAFFCGKDRGWNIFDCIIAALPQWVQGC